jgi:RNA polymerase sigma factor (sigma-70 family)
MNSTHTTLLYHFCRLRLPRVPLPADAFVRCTMRALDMYRAKRGREGLPATWDDFVENLHALDWFVACACLERLDEGWRVLAQARANRTDALLVDALRARAVRLFPRDPEKQDEAVAEFWGFLLAGEREGSTPILARYDGQRPLVPWLIRVFQNKHLSDLRHERGRHALPEDDLDDRDLPFPADGDDRWHEEFRQAAREWLADLPDSEVLILGLRLRYRLSQREAATVLGINEGNVSRQTAKLRDRCLERIGRRLQEVGWTGDDLSAYILKEMDTLLLDEPRLSADRLAALLAARGKKKPGVRGQGSVVSRGPC